MGPNGLPGPPGVKVSSLHFQNVSAQKKVTLFRFLLLLLLLFGYQPQNLCIHRVIKEKQVLVCRYNTFLHLL